MRTLFSFSGRIGRGKFWLAHLSQILLSLAAIAAIYSILFIVPGGQLFVLNPDRSLVLDDLGNPVVNRTNPKTILVWIIMLVAPLLSLWWLMAVAVKRLHDRGKSGWWVLLMIPITITLVFSIWWPHALMMPPVMTLTIILAGVIWWLVDLGILEGQEGANKYGPDPRGGDRMVG